MSGARAVGWLSLFCLAATVAGCDQLSPSSDSTPSTAEEDRESPLVKALAKVGFMYHDYHDVHAVGPANWEELATMAKDDPAKLDAIQTVKDQGYNLKWGVRFRDLTQGMTTTVMGESPQGGPKLMFDASVQN